ncbi:MAG: putative toxin-antitoxin system toxin component, PIN family [Verrucomicrobiales bacterium]|jgi:putative PIN family toxin of toxin-antitoxin system|nr:putative toxin-antitoxin system toxin component, PIN family [Verrucomicrobiales bacterium]
MIAVLDTNVLVSGLMVDNHAPGYLLKLIRFRRLTLAIDYRVWDEYCAVLARAKFLKYFSVGDKDNILTHIKNHSQWVTCGVTVSGLPDPKDACFLEMALQTNAPLVTGNLKHFPAKLHRGARVFTPADFLKEFFRG